MSREIKDFLNTLDDWTLYLERGDSMPYATFKLGSPIQNMLVQADCFDRGDLELVPRQGCCVFSDRQVGVAQAFFKRIGMGSIQYQGAEFWRKIIKMERD